MQVETFIFQLMGKVGFLLNWKLGEACLSLSLSSSPNCGTIE